MKKWKFIIGGIAILCLFVYIGYLNVSIYSLKNTISENKIEIQRLADENRNLSTSLTKSQNEVELNKTTIDGLISKNEELADTKNNEIDVWKKKYSYCIKNKNTTMKIAKDEVMNNETSDFYINMYNNDIFN